jgi:hypothetical protein
MARPRARTLLKSVSVTVIVCARFVFMTSRVVPDRDRDQGKTLYEKNDPRMDTQSGG